MLRIDYKGKRFKLSISMFLKKYLTSCANFFFVFSIYFYWLWDPREGHRVISTQITPILLLRIASTIEGSGVVTEPLAVCGCSRK